MHLFIHIFLLEMNGRISRFHNTVLLSHFKWSMSMCSVIKNIPGRGRVPHKGKDKMARTSGNSVRRWLVLSAACLSVFLHGGVAPSCSTILLDVQKEFGVSTSYIGLVFSLSQSFVFLLSPINTPLLKRFSMRQVTVVGGIISAAGICLSSFTHTGFLFAIALLLYGIGFSPVYLACFSVPAHYFPRSFSIVSGVVASAGGIGLMTLPYMTSVFRDIYGWRGALLLTAALNLHVVVFGALLTDRKGKHDAIDHIDKEAKMDECAGDSEIGIVNHAAEVNETIPLLTSEVAQELASQEIESSDDDYCSRTVVNKSDSAGCDKEPLSTRSQPVEKSHLQSTFSTKNNRKTSSRTQSSEIPPAEDSSICSSCQRLISGTLEEFDLHQFRDFPITISILSVMFFAFSINHFVWVSFVIPNALSKGLALDQAVFLTTIGGNANIVGRFLGGGLASKQIISNEALYFTALFLSGLAFFVNYAATSMWLLGMLSAVNGYSVGFKTTMLYILVKVKLPSDRYQGALSIFFTMSGLGTMVCGPITGALFDATGSYNAAFGIAGLIDVVLGLPLAVLARQENFARES